jgi:hypothetical protein
MARAGVTIDSGELPSARGVAEGYQLSNVITRWQHVAAGSFREDCRFLKQMIEETDELRLWEKNVGGFTYPSRDDFLRKQVLIDFDLTERDMTEIVAALKHDDVDKVRDQLAAKLKATKPLAPHGANQHSKDLAMPNSSGGTNSKYLLARIKRDRPDIAEAMERGKYKSIRSAAIAAGFVKPESALTMTLRWYRRMTPTERAAFLAEINDKGQMQ